MRITDELREYAQRYKNSHDAWSGIGDDLDQIADRIDGQAEGEYTRGYTAGFNEASDGIEAADELRERIEREYIKAPVDAEDMPWRIGDTIEWPDGQTAEVVGISANTLFYIEHDFDDSAQWTAAHDKRHVKPDSWERIIEDAIAEGYERINLDCALEFSNADLIARCKRLAEKESHAGA